MATECAVCYVSDINFLLPSLVSAASLRKFVPAHKADIFIFLADQEARVSELNRFLQPYNIQIVPMDSRMYSQFDKEKFNKTHVPPASLGRFFLDALLPESSRRIVYIDGDTWIARDPSALIDAIVPDGKIAVAEDILSFRATVPTRRGLIIRKYFRKLGLTRQHGYFNAGVFAVARNTWRTLAKESHAYFLENTVACKNQDQSALNAVIGDRRLPLSLKWNFQTPFRRFGIDKKINPHIYHFTQAPKPWMGPCEPWVDIYEVYQAALTPFSSLMLPIKKYDPARVAAHNKHTRLKFFPLKSRLISNLALMYMSFDAVESQAWL